MTTDRLAALLEEALEANGVSLGQRSRYESIATRLAAAGVTVAHDPSCCELACYEDEGCQCEGCVGPAPDPEACTVCGAVDCTGHRVVPEESDHHEFKPIPQPAPDALRAAAQAVVQHDRGYHDGLDCSQSEHLAALRAALGDEP